MKKIDVLIMGGSAGGLTAAITARRTRRKVQNEHQVQKGHKKYYQIPAQDIARKSH
jgi:thioredoxin reductase